MLFVRLQWGVEICYQILTVHLLHTTRDLQGIMTDMSIWRVTFAGRLKGANGE